MIMSSFFDYVLSYFIHLFQTGLHIYEVMTNKIFGLYEKFLRMFQETLESFKSLPEIAQKMKFYSKGLFSKCDQMRSFLRIWSHLLKKSLMEKFLFCAVTDAYLGPYQTSVMKLIFFIKMVKGFQPLTIFPS